MNHEGVKKIESQTDLYGANFDRIIFSGANYSAMKSERFSVSARFKSFKYSFAGIVSFFRKEHNSWIHFAATIAVFVLSWAVGVTKTEMIALVIVIGIVWTAEIFNTCIERIMDFISPKTDPDIKIIKDLASAAVLMSAIAALVTGLIVFIPKFI